MYCLPGTAEPHKALLGWKKGERIRKERSLRNKPYDKGYESQPKEDKPRYSPIIMKCGNYSPDR
jgi:hypothetical protein